MLEDFFERIETQYKKQLPFVVYRKPNTHQVLSLLQNNDELFYANQFTEQGFVFSPFEDLNKTVLIPSNSSEAIAINFVPSGAIESSQILNAIDDVSKENHIILVKKGIEAINNTELKKVVLSRNEAVMLSDNNPISIFKNLLSKYQSAFVYCWFHPKIGLWLGATPETLLKIEGNRFSMMSLAGTQEYKGTLDVVWQNKEQQEQQFVTDFIVDNLKSMVSEFKVSDVETVKSGNLLHLKTMITAQLKPDTNLKAIVTKLHPTPAVCGLPKQTAKEFILTHEGYNREFYTGFLGELNIDTKLTSRSSKRNIENRAYTITKKSTQLYVNLRCMQLKENDAIIYVGGGITESSNPELEWDETVAKSLVIKTIL